MRRRLSLAQQLFVLQLVVIVLLVSAGAVLVFLDARRDNEEDAARRVRTLAEGLAHLPQASQAFDDDDPAAALQPLAEGVRKATGTDFVVFMAPDRTRYSHPNPDEIGNAFIGTIEPALAGRSLTETYEGTLGPSVRAVVPVKDGERVIGLVSIGLLREKVGQELLDRIPLLVAISLGAIAVAALGSVVISRRLSRQTLGLGPAEITRMYEHHDAVLHAVREGLLILDEQHRLVLANDEATRLLGLDVGQEGVTAREAGVDEPLAGLLASEAPVDDELVVYRDRVLVVNQQRTEKDGRRLGTVTTLRDHTELQTLSGELDSARGFAEALRSQAHESANRLHTVVTMIELGQPERAVEFATVELASAQQLADQVVSAVDEPALAALLLGKAAQAHEKGVELVVTPDTAVSGVDVEPRDLVTLVGNLVDNAIDAALAAPPLRRVEVTARSDADGLLVRVADSGRGVDAAHVDDIFARGWSTKPADGARGQGLGLSLVKQVINRYDGVVDVDTGGDTVFTVRLRHTGATEGAL